MRRATTGLIAALCGCSFFTPGADTRKALEQTTTTTWDQFDNLSIAESSTHNREVVAGENNRDEGEAVEIERNAEGVVKVKGATHVLYSNSEPKDAAATYMKLAEQNQLAWSNTMQAMLAMTGQILQFKIASGAQDNAADLARMEARLQAMERILERLAPTQPVPNYGENN